VNNFQEFEGRVGDRSNAFMVQDVVAITVCPKRLLHFLTHGWQVS
jgi:hypothetical protein